MIPSDIRMYYILLYVALIPILYGSLVPDESKDL